MATRSMPSTTRAGAGWSWAVLGAVLGVLLALTLFAPARWLAAALAYWTNGHLQLVNARGTVWNGNAGLVFSSGASGAESVSLPGVLGWALRPHWQGVSAAIDIPCCAAAPLRFMARPGPAGLELNWVDGRSRWPAALLVGFGAPWNTLKLDGTRDIATQALALRWKGPQLAIAGRATLDATDMSSSLSTLRPLGRYRIALEGR